MRARRVVLTTTLAAAGAVAVMVPAAHADPGEVDLHATLHGSSHYPHARGFSEYERGGGERDVSVTVRAPGIPRRYVVVYVNRHRVGRILLSSTGYGHREWETDHGQYVPFASSGDPVRVRRASTSGLVAGGYYHREAD